MSNTPGQPPRGDAALMKAIATGSPVATNGKQEAELREWQCKFANHNFIVSRHGDSPAFSCIFEGSGEWLAKTLNSHPSLHAYAKAEELRHQWIRSQLGAAGKAALEAYDAHLVTMGWDSVQPRPDFLATHRAAALAKAGGQ